jgi:DNA-binding transcriptional regulator GbsR (MarR family)
MMSIEEKIQEGEYFRLFDTNTKQFVQFQKSKECTDKWQRYISKDKSQWIKINECLSEEEVRECLTKIKKQ